MALTVIVPKSQCWALRIEAFSATVAELAGVTAACRGPGVSVQECRRPIKPLQFSSTNESTDLQDRRERKDWSPLEGSLARKKTSFAEDLMDLVSLLPWWVGVTLAVISYMLLHRLVVPPTVTALPPSQMGDVIARSMISAFAGLGQYVLPLICLAGAGVSAWRRRQRRTLISNTTQAKGADALNGMSWREFEILVGEAFRLQGFSVSETGGGGADGGVDLVLSKGTEKFLVQCKQWKAYKVGVDVVRELYGVMAARGATGGFVVTSGSFSEDAKAFADGRNVKLVDGHRLFGLIKQAKHSLSSRASTAGKSYSEPSTYTSEAKASVVACPTCGSEMVRRTAKKGANAGEQFWGCSRYPSCRGVRPLA